MTQNASNIFDQRESISNNTPNTPSGKCCKSKEDLVFLATSLAFTLSKGLGQRELETLINLLGITTATLSAIFAQRAIDCNEFVEPIL